MQERYIDTPEALAELCAQLARSETVMLDTEFMREKTYRAQLCLIQVYDGEIAACIDPLALADLGPLLEILYDPNIVKVLHAARQDLEIFHDLTGKVPAPVFDTQIAAALAGYADQIGYGNLVREVLGVELDKSHTRTDWSRRPLDRDQIRYALDDVRYLAEVHRRLVEALEARGRLRWLDADFDALVDPGLYRSDPSSAWRRVKGAGKLKPQQLAVLSELAAWREERALESNRPRRWILADDPLLALARIQPLDDTKLASVRGLEAGQAKKIGRQLLERIRAARGLPKEQWPKLPDFQRPTPQQEALSDLLMAVVRLRAEEQSISVQSLAGRKELDALARGERDLGVLMGWRRTLVGNDLIDLVEERAELHLKNAQLQIRPRT